MKETLYETIKNDIKKNEFDVYTSDNLLEVLDTYDILLINYKEKINEEDLFTLLKEKYLEVNDYDSKLYDNLINIIKEYFLNNKKDINKNYEKLNCGKTIDELPELITRLKKKTTEYNSTARKLRIIGVTEITLGLLTGFACLFSGDSNSFMVFLTIVIATFVSGMVFVGFSEIIQILHDIRKKI